MWSQQFKDIIAGIRTTVFTEGSWEESCGSGDNELNIWKPKPQSPYSLKA